jgi:hypothetical protein
MTTELLPVALVKRKGQCHLLAANTISVSRFPFSIGHPISYALFTFALGLGEDSCQSLIFFRFTFCLFLEYTARSDWTCFGASRHGFHHDWKGKKRDGGII